MNPPNRLQAYFIAPMATLLCIVVFATAESMFWMMAGIAKLNDPSTEVLLLFGLLIGVPVLYILSALVGVPVVWWLEKRNKVSLRHFALAGLVCGFALAAGDSFFLRSSKYDDHLKTFVISLVYVGAPVTFGFVSCWYIGYRTTTKTLNSAIVL